MERIAEVGGGGGASVGELIAQLQQTVGSYRITVYAFLSFRRDQREAHRWHQIPILTACKAQATTRLRVSTGSKWIHFTGSPDRRGTVITATSDHWHAGVNLFHFHPPRL